MAASSAPVLDVERTVTVNKPTDHFTELLYCGLTMVLLGFVIFMGHVHNDSLAAKGMDFVYLILGALTQASRSGGKP
jgi:hypothetical protein